MWPIRWCRWTGMNPGDITARAKEEAALFPLRLMEAPGGKKTPESPPCAPGLLPPFPGERVKVRAMGREAVTVRQRGDRPAPGGAGDRR